MPLTPRPDIEPSVDEDGHFRIVMLGPDSRSVSVRVEWDAARAINLDYEPDSNVPLYRGTFERIAAEKFARGYVNGGVVTVTEDDLLVDATSGPISKPR